MKKIALLTLLLINLSLSFSLPRNQASPAIFSVTQSAGTILFRHTDSTQTIIPCQSVASIVSNADPSKVVSVWVVQQGDYDKIMQFDYSVCGFSTKQEAVDSVTVWASCLYVSDSAYTTILYTNTDSATITSYDVLNSQNAPPGSPATGDTYLVGTSPSGAWIGHSKDIAEWNGSSWDFTDGVQGDFLYNATNALTYIFRSGNWVQTTGIPALNNGNTISSGLIIGTNNARSLTFETNNVNRGRFDSVGRFYVYDTSLRKANKYLQIDSITGRLVASEISGSSASSLFITKTKAEIDALITANELVAGALYEITGVHPTLYDDGTTSGTTIYLRAISGNQLEVQGMGKFYNPKYNQAVDGFGIWDNKMYGAFSTIVGNFDYQNKETVTSDNGATGILLANGMIQYVSGNWSSATSITGGTSSATANVADFVSPSYAVNDKVIWGGYLWTNVNGNIGASTDVLTLDSEWIKDVYDTTNYNIAYDVIEYDYANNWISRRYELASNVDVKITKSNFDLLVDNYGFIYSSISVQQFGNPFDFNIGKGIFNKSINNAYDESINFSGASQYNLTFGQISGQYSLTFGQSSIQQNLTFGQNSSQYSLTFGQSSIQQNLTFGQSSSQSGLTFGSGSGQNNLTFGDGSALNYNSQVISSNMQYITFNTKNVTVPDLSAATLIFDGNVKEVYQRPNGALKIRYYDNSDALVIADIAD